MKRYLLILFIIIPLMASCSSAQVKQPETPAEKPAAETRATQETTTESEEAKEPEAESAEVSEAEAPAAVADAVPEEETVTEEQPVEEQEVIEDLPVEAVAQEAPVEEAADDEQDWSRVIGTAPSEEIREEEPEFDTASATTVSEPAAEASESEKLQTYSSVKQPSLTDRLISLFKRVGNFIADEILLSIGIFVCFGGIIYFFVALAVSDRHDKQRNGSGDRNSRREKVESDSFTSGRDKEPENDEDFLKSLLGDDSN